MNSNKKILMVGPDLDGLGGISRVIKIWQENDFFEDFKMVYVKSTSAVQNNKIVFLFRSIFNFLILLTKEIKIVYIHTSSFKSFYRKSIFIILSKIFRKKTILHIHPNHFVDFIKQENGFLSVYIKYIIGKIDYFVVLNNEVKNDIKCIVKYKPVYVLKNCININSMLNTNKIERSSSSLLYLGRYVRTKGVYDLVDAVDKLIKVEQDITLNFYGNDEVEKLRKYVSDKDLTKYIAVNGWAGLNEKLDLLYGHSALVLPTYSEGLPNVILEAMATKTPILSTSVGGLKNVLRDRENAIIFEVGNINDLSEKIIMVLKDKELMEGIADRAYQDVNKLYDVKTIKYEFNHILDDILN